MVHGGLASSGKSDDLPLRLFSENTFYIEEYIMHDIVTYILLKTIQYGLLVLLIGAMIELILYGPY